MCFLPKIDARPIKAKLHMVLSWNGEMEMTSNGIGHMTKLAAMPICWNQKTDDLETWYAAFSTQVLPNLSK